LATSLSVPGSPEIEVEHSLPKYGFESDAWTFPAGPCTKSKRFGDFGSFPTEIWKALGATAGYFLEPVDADSEQVPLARFVRACALKTPRTFTIPRPIVTRSPLVTESMLGALAVAGASDQLALEEPV